MNGPLRDRCCSTGCCWGRWAANQSVTYSKRFSVEIRPVRCRSASPVRRPSTTAAVSAPMRASSASSAARAAPMMMVPVPLPCGSACCGTIRPTLWEKSAAVRAPSVPPSPVPRVRTSAPLWQQSSSSSLRRAGLRSIIVRRKSPETDVAYGASLRVSVIARKRSSLRSPRNACPLKCSTTTSSGRRAMKNRSICSCAVRASGFSRTSTCRKLPTSGARRTPASSSASRSGASRPCSSASW
jgi:hypothetical protein